MQKSECTHSNEQNAVTPAKDTPCTAPLQSHVNIYPNCRWRRLGWKWKVGRKKPIEGGPERTPAPVSSILRFLARSIHRRPRAHACEGERVEASVARKATAYGTLPIGFTSAGASPVSLLGDMEVATTGRAAVSVIPVRTATFARIFFFLLVFYCALWRFGRMDAWNGSTLVWYTCVLLDGSGARFPSVMLTCF
jgi:hypothetical protein